MKKVRCTDGKIYLTDLKSVKIGDTIEVIVNYSTLEKAIKVVVEVIDE